MRYNRNYFENKSKTTIPTLIHSPQCHSPVKVNDIEVLNSNFSKASLTKLDLSRNNKKKGEI
jgi:hypothetical protein